MDDIYIPLKTSAKFNTKFGLIRFLKREEALNAVHAPDGTVIRDFKLQVNLAKFAGNNSNIVEPRKTSNVLTKGLPAQHFCYVKNIEPGMPLFLFNYTDRKLHGIFEAASPGQMNLNPYAWTTNGSGRTVFPAQGIKKIASIPRVWLWEERETKLLEDCINFNKLSA